MTTKITTLFYLRNMSFKDIDSFKEAMLDPSNKPKILGGLEKMGAKDAEILKFKFMELNDSEARVYLLVSTSINAEQLEAIGYGAVLYFNPESVEVDEAVVDLYRAPLQLVALFKDGPESVFMAVLRVVSSYTMVRPITDLTLDNIGDMLYYYNYLNAHYKQIPNAHDKQL